MNRIVLLACITGAGMSSLGAVEPVAPGRGTKSTTGEELNVRPRMTHEQLAKLQRPRDPKFRGQTAKLSDLQKRSLRKDSEESAKAATRRESLVARSTIVSGSSSWTIVPRGAVLSTPARFKGLVNGQRKGRLVTWYDFHAQNSSWIRLLPVTLEQATGQDPLSKDYIESLKRTGLLVVATCQGGPISVHLPVEGKAPPKVSKPIRAADWKTPSRR